MQRHVQLFAHCTCSARTVHAHCKHTARAFSTSGSTILTAQSTCLPHTTIQRTNHSLLFSSAEHSQCSVWVKCYPGPFREAINCYVESTLLGSKALLYSSLLHRLAFKLPPRPDFYSDDYLFLALTVNSDQRLCLAIVSYDLPIVVGDTLVF